MKSLPTRETAELPRQIYNYENMDGIVLENWPEKA